MWIVAWYHFSGIDPLKLLCVELLRDTHQKSNNSNEKQGSAFPYIENRESVKNNRYN